MQRYGEIGNWNYYGLIDGASKLVSPREFFELVETEIEYYLSQTILNDELKAKVRLDCLSAIESSLRGKFDEELAQVLSDRRSH